MRFHRQGSGMLRKVIRYSYTDVSASVDANKKISESFGVGVCVNKGV